MSKYELLLVLPGTLDEKEAEAKTKEVVDIINEFGQDADMLVLGKNRLAYPIQQVRYGYFFTVIFSAETESVKKIEEKLKLSRGLLRAMITHFNKATVGAQKFTYFNEMPPQEEVVRNEVEEAVVAPVEEKAEVPAEEQTEKIDEPVKEDVVVEAPVVVEELPKAKAKPKTLDLKEIDKKLDEILAEDNINI